LHNPDFIQFFVNIQRHLVLLLVPRSQPALAVRAALSTSMHPMLARATVLNRMIREILSGSLREVHESSRLNLR
jgi:hypothetical protein